MTRRTLEVDPVTYARIAAVLWLLEGLTAVFGQFFVLGRLVVHGDAVATAANILGQQTLFRLGFASSLVAVALHVALALAFYWLLKPVNRKIALLATFVLLVGCGLQAIASLFHLAPLLILEGGRSLGALTIEQLQALASLFLRLNAHAFNSYLVFFGLWCTLVGYLIAQSTFLPRVIGLLMVLAGLGYLTLLYAPLANFLHPYNMAMAAPGELGLLLWLILKGVDARSWREQAGAPYALGP